MFLKKIISRVQRELERRKTEVPESELERLAHLQSPALDFAAALRGDSLRFICEVKKSSPSKGVICQDFDPAALASDYAAGGAAAVSVLTEADYFHGSLGHLRAVKRAVEEKLPVMRKDFILERYQLYETLAYGADAVLLIVAALTPEKLRALLVAAHALGLECLVEAHTADEVETAVECGGRVIGINNRNLSTFEIDLAVTERLRPFVPLDRLVVAESGLTSRADVLRMEAAGVNAVLVGEALVRAPDPAAKLRELRGQD
jgi:indole-3-glycerol phosphate synthase